jgi:hypothetical protein
MTKSKCWREEKTLPVRASFSPIHEKKKSSAVFENVAQRCGMLKHTHTYREEMSQLVFRTGSPIYNVVDPFLLYQTNPICARPELIK